VPANAITRQRAEDATIGAFQRALILKSFPGFAHLGAPDLAVMSSICRERFFPAGATMLEPGVPPLAFYLVVSGRAQVLRNGEPADEHGPKSSVGGLAAMTRDPRGTHAVALEDTLALEIDTDDMQDVFEDHFTILVGVLRALARTMRELQIATRQGAAVSTPTQHQGVTSDRPLTLVERMFFLRRTQNFAKVSIEAVADLAARHREVRFRAGDVIWNLGDAAEDSILVLNGTISCQPPDREHFDLGVGYIVGGLDALSGEPRWYKLVAKTDVLAMRQLRDDMLDVLEDHSEAALALTRTLAGGVIAMLDRLSAHRAAERRKSEPPSSRDRERVRQDD
jgi:CRP-like cAMP-binding protein